MSLCPFQILTSLSPMVSVSTQFVGRCLTEHTACPRRTVNSSFLAASGKIFDLGPRRIQLETMSLIKLLDLSKSRPLHLLSGDTSSYPSGLLGEANEIAQTQGRKWILTLKRWKGGVPSGIS